MDNYLVFAIFAPVLVFAGVWLSGIIFTFIAEFFRLFGKLISK